MITTVTLNPCLDMTLRLKSLTPGALNLVEDSRLDAAGKGLNVSVVLRALGLSNIAIGINFENNGGELTRYLDTMCVAHDFAFARGSVRTNIKIMDALKSEMTEVNSPGDEVEPHIVESYLLKLARHAGRSDIITLSGRIPNGGGKHDYSDIYARSLSAVKGLDILTVVDAEKEPLLKAMEEQPYLIKPNLFELETAFGCKCHSHRDIVDACRDVIKRGVSVVCCSLGGDGAIIADRLGAFHAPPVQIEVKGLQGAGDSLVAGLCKGLKAKLGLEGMLRCGVAAATASLTREGTLLCRTGDYEAILPKVRVVAI